MLKDRARQLNERRFDAVRFRGPGTDLTVGLLPIADWTAAGICAHQSAMRNGGEVIIPSFG